MSRDDRRPRLYGVKMRASLGGEHISGAERIVPPGRIAGTLSALCRRAFGHERGAPDSVNMKVEALGEVSRIRALPVFEVKVPDAAAGWARAVEILSAAGVSRAAEIAGLFTSAHSMRGAMLVDADTLERLEPDHARGVRATNMDGDPSPPADRKDHFAEALTLASKVLSTPGIVGEICVSDDPSYVTGYVATKDGYHRISVLKERGDPRGGRIFIYGGDRRRVAEAIRRLESAPVVVERAASPRLPRMEGIAADLAALDAAGLTRKIRMRRADVVSFADNDYLGLAGDPRVKAAAAEAAERFGAGSGASRLVVGTQPPHLDLERRVARFKGVEDAISFATGYMANLGTIAALAGKGDVILSDALNHASIVDGCRLSGAETIVYPHLDMDALDAALGEVRGARRVLVVSDGVFSMDGDMLDLPRFIDVCRRHDAFSMVDEAHATGVVGASGRGLCERFGCAPPDIAMGTFSKALGSSGGYVAGAASLVEYLRQKARTFVFSTAPGAAAVAAADAALAVLEADSSLVWRLHGNIRSFVDAMERAVPGLRFGRETAVFPIVVGDERRAVRISEELEARGFLVPAIRYPSVAKGKARLRVALSARHTEDELAALAGELARFAPFEGTGG